MILKMKTESHPSADRCLEQTKKDDYKMEGGPRK